MYSLCFVIALLLPCVVAQGDSVLVRVQAIGTSENVVTREQAIANAVADASRALTKAPCTNVELLAQAEARKVVEAAATATAASTISIQTAGRGQGTGASRVEAESSATAIAEAIAEAIATAVNGATATGRTTSAIEVKQTARAVVQQRIIAAGDADAVISVLARSTVFVAAVAEALARAFANCDTATAQVVTQSREVPAPTDIKFADSNAVVNSLGPGSLINVLQNSANAFTLQSSSSTTPTVPAVPPTQSNSGTPGPASVTRPTPPGGVAISGDVFTSSAQSLVNLLGQFRN